MCYNILANTYIMLYYMHALFCHMHMKHYRVGTIFISLRLTGVNLSTETLRNFLKVTQLSRLHSKCLNLGSLAPETTRLLVYFREASRGWERERAKKAHPLSPLGPQEGGAPPGAAGKGVVVAFSGDLLAALISPAHILHKQKLRKGKSYRPRSHS